MSCDIMSSSTWLLILVFLCFVLYELARVLRYVYLPTSLYGTSITIVNSSSSGRRTPPEKRERLGSARVDWRCRIRFPLGLDDYTALNTQSSLCSGRFLGKEKDKNSHPTLVLFFAGREAFACTPIPPAYQRALRAGDRSGGCRPITLPFWE